MSKEQQQKMSILLVVSLALNLFLGGLIVGGAIMKHRLPPMQAFDEVAPPMRTFLNPRELIRGTSDETRQKLKGLAFKNLKEMRPQLKQVHAARVELYNLLAAENFDEEAVRQAVVELSNAERDAQIASGDTIISMLELMTPEERARIVKVSDRPWHHEHDDDHERREHGDRWQKDHDD